MNEILIAFLVTFTPLLGIFFLGIRNERIRMERIYRASVIQLHKRSIRR